MPLNETEILKTADEIIKLFDEYRGPVSPMSYMDSTYRFSKDEHMDLLCVAAIEKLNKAKLLEEVPQEGGLYPAYILTGLGRTIVPNYGSFSEYVAATKKPSFLDHSKRWSYPVAIGAAIIASGGVVHSIITSSKADRSIEKLEERIESLESSLNKSTITLDSLKILTAPKDSL